MFDQTHSRPDLADRLATLLVALVFLVALAAIPLASLDFERATTNAAEVTAKAPATGSDAVELATSERCAPCRTVVLRTHSRATEVPSTGPL